jgi:antitoxin VapB
MAITTVFTNNRSQAVRLPSELRLPDNVKRVKIRAVGNERIITPVDQTWDSFFNDGPKVSTDYMRKRTSQEQAEREPL